MTEDEAKTKWCPFARSIVTHSDVGGFSPPYNRMNTEKGPSALDSSNSCIGSSCMAWRWNKSPKDANRENARSDFIKAKAEGYCGLAK